MLSIAVIMNLVDLHDGLSNCIPFNLSTLLEMMWVETHKIWCGFTVHLAHQICMVVVVHLEECVYHTTYNGVLCTLMQWSQHIKSGVLLQHLAAHSTIWCSYSTLQILCPEWICIFWSALHTHYGVCCTLVLEVWTTHALQ